MIEQYKGGKWVAIKIITSNATTSFKVTGLKASTANKFRIKAYKSYGSSKLYSGYVSKISAHIVKKVADKLNAMFNNDREAFESIWRDIKTFVEYGCMKDRKFYDRVSASLLLEKCGGGGHYDVAGAQMESETVSAVLEELKSSIDSYLDEIYQKN